MFLLVHPKVIGKAFSAFDKDRGGTISNDEIGKQRTQFGRHAASPVILAIAVYARWYPETSTSSLVG